LWEGRVIIDDTVAPSALDDQQVPLPDVMLSSVSGMPLYRQLAMVLRQLIGAQEQNRGMLPPEMEIAEHFGVSRNTVRQAMGELVTEGLLVRKRGIGTHLAGPGPRPWAMDSWDGLFTATRAEGVELTTEPMRVEVAPLPNWASGRLGLVAGEPGVIVQRRRRVDDRVLNLSTNYLPRRFGEVVLEADLARESLYELLRKEFGVTVHGAHRVLDAVVFDEVLAARLEANAGEPAVLIESVVWDRSMEAFDCHRVWHRTSVMSLEVNTGERP